MFYPEPVQKLVILSHHSVKQKVVRKLHELGAVQINDFKHKLSSDTNWGEILSSHPVSQDIRTITTQLMGVNRLLDIFNMVSAEEEEGFFKKLFAASPPEKIKVEDMYGEALLQKVSSTVSVIEDNITEPLEKMEKSAAEIAELNAQGVFFEKIRSINLPIELAGEGTFVNTLVGTAPVKDFTPLRQELEKATGGMVFFAHQNVSEETACVAVVCLSRDKDDISGIVRKWDIEKMPSTAYSGTPSDAVAEIRRKINLLESIQNECREKIRGQALNWRKQLKTFREFLTIDRERAEVFSGFAQTDAVTAIQGWVIKDKAAAIIKQIESFGEGLAVAFAEAPDEPPENLPVSLKNPGIIKHFELLVKLYAPPKYDEVDPTVLIFPSFLFFFGIMITDAMYGIVALILGILILRGGGRYYPLFRSAGVLLSLGGLSTVFMGAMTGGWFGNLLVEYLGLSFLDKLVVINPMVDVAPFLLFALGVGLLHLNIGIVVGIIKDARRKDIPQALKHVWIFFLEISLVCYYFEQTTAAGVFAVPALLLLLYSAKGMALFGITGLLGDTLSYARLMALGLVSFGLAVAINALSEMTFGISYIGWLLAIVILVFGHSFSLLLNLMGGFAHGIRLHFVEFFGKFYSGGGEEFTPFKIKRNVTEVY